MVNIKLANEDEFEKVREFYYSMIDAMENAKYGPGWKKGLYPADEYLRDSINKHQLFVGTIGKEIVAAMIVNHDSNDGYAEAKWKVQADPQEVTVIHALGVHPDFGGRGIAKELVAWVTENAKENRQKVLRLDVLEGNLPAERLYLSIGFQYIDTVEMYYEDTGWTNYELFEYKL